MIPTWEDMAERSGGQISTIQGRPAYVEPGSSDKGTYPVVLMNVDGRLITMLGMRHDALEEVKAVAARMDLESRLIPGLG